MCPLAYILPATAQAASQASGSLADNYTVPLLLSTLLGGVVFGAFNDRATKKVLEESVSGISTSTEAPSKDTSLAFAGKPGEATAAEETNTQLEALPVLEAKEIDGASLAGIAETSVVPVPAPAIAVAATAAPAAPWAPAVKVPSETATPTTLQQRGEAIFDLAAETARRMQAEYEAKVAAIKAEGERRREAELRRRQQRYAALDRLQAAAASQASSAADTPQDNTQGPLARLVGLFLAMWAWLKERFGSLFTHTSNSSSAASA
ncbi:hypothetical protein WJX75_009408 [Coccomyxa subellipsoidea]|uniref:Uncharacterized protein n=1 Tax=Coccomyxa subellipsoidea TaxID=248742 RepID=A0ABR2Z116_9CHLO